MVTHEAAKSRVEQNFWSHVAAFVVLSSLLMALSFGDSSEEAHWMVAAWGSVLAIHALLYLSPDSRQQMVDRTRTRMDWQQQHLDSRRTS